MDKFLEEYKKRVKEKNQDLTVFVLTYNREGYLKLALDSILKQTYDNYTVIVLDNYSIDNTEYLVNSYNDERVLYKKRVSNLENSDSNMRYAFDICITKYLIVFHDDDTIQPTFISKALQEIKATNCDAVSIGGRIIDEDNNYTGEVYGKLERRFFVEEEYFSYFFSSNSGSMLYPSVIYNREFFDDYKKYVTVMDVGPCNDQFLFFQMCRYGGKICMDNSCLMNYRIHTNQDSKKNEGFIEIELVDALLKIPFYEEMINKYLRKIKIRIIGRFLTISNNYCKGKIDKEKYITFFNYQCLKLLQDTLIDRIILFFMKQISKCKRILSMVCQLDNYRRSKRGIK